MEKPSKQENDIEESGNLSEAGNKDQSNEQNDIKNNEESELHEKPITSINQTIDLNGEYSFTEKKSHSFTIH